MRMSTPVASISASTFSRRADRSAAASGWTSVVVLRAPGDVVLRAPSEFVNGASERVVRVVGHRLVTVLGDEQALLGPVAAGAVLPDDRLQHQHHAGGEDERCVERLADVAADVRHLGAVDAETVAEVEVRHPRLLP